jgi:tetratricopeptide (TPR) repeat protein
MKKLISLLLLTLLISTTLTVESCIPIGDKSKKEVQKAFQLRINGKVDEAKAILEDILIKDSSNAMAWFEMARLKHYMLIGGGSVIIEDILIPINNAVRLEPNNVTYSYYKGIVLFLNAFISMQTGQGEVKHAIMETSTQFEKVLTLKPDYHEAKLYLVEIYGMLPPEMGGDSSKAVAYAASLASKNLFFGTKAKAAIASDNTDLFLLWEELLSKDLNNPQVLEELGKVYLYNDDIDGAEKYFGKAIAADATNNILILDLARYHMMKVMQNKDLAAVHLPMAKIFIEKYLKSSPEPIIPLKAYAIGLIAKIDMFSGNQAEAQKLMAEAKLLDPYFSRASGIPELLLFDSPDQISHHYSSFFSPF